VVRRAAFTLIELIFAIVIIAITVVSLPMMNQVIGKEIDSNIVQEAIFAAATELNEVVTAHWDENSIDTALPNSYARVIDHLGLCENNSSKANYRQMPGHINQPLHRSCLNDSTVTPSNVNVAAVTSLSDMAHGAQNIFTTATLDASGYKKSYTSEVAVSRPANFDGNNTNIKKVEITIKSGATTLTKLRTYSCNIGEVDYFKRSF